MPRVTRKKSGVKEEPAEVESDREEEKCEATATTISIKSAPQSHCLMISSGKLKSGMALVLALISFVSDDLLDGTNVKIVKLRHPRTATGSLYAFSCKDSKLFEINTFEDGKR